MRRKTKLRSFLDSIELLKREFDGGATLPLERASFRPRNPFAQRKP
jgi:hypothetical protein